MSEYKSEILKRILLIYVSILIFSIAIIVKVIYIQFYEGKMWRQKAKDFALQYQPIEATRGNIYADDGKKLLATSIPMFEIRMDVGSKLITDKIFENNIDSLSDCLSILFKDKSKSDYFKMISKARRQKDRYLLIKRNVDYPQLKKLRHFPIFILGRNNGGLIVKQTNKREMPYKQLAYRTVGFNRKDVVVRTKEKTIRKDAYVGLEGYYNDKLIGTNGKRIVRRVAGLEYVPVSDINITDPKNGNDIITTIDIDIQDVAEAALMRNLEMNKADHGCAILMEVKTGCIKAIANLKRDTTKGYSNYIEAMNYALSESTEPGSTFKLASLLVALEDKVVDTNSIVHCGTGVKKFCGHDIKDVHKGYGDLTVKKVFEVSSNVGVASIISDNYFNNPKRFIDGLYRMGIYKKTGVAMIGEANPYIKNTKSKSWSDCSISRMCIGYELTMTPLQLLTFYNAIANNGRMVRPMFVKEIRQERNLMESFPTYTLNPSICSAVTLGKVKKMLEGVVTNGTAKKLFVKSLYKVAGKTGTTELNYGKGQAITHKASFAGYFPADNPKYSCIVVVTNPAAGRIFGGDVAAPVFREIADKVYATLLDNEKTRENIKTDKRGLTQIKRINNKNDVDIICKTFNYPLSIPQNNASTVKPAYEWISTTADSLLKFVSYHENIQGTLPDFTGMSLKDAIYILQNIGLDIIVSGKGLIKSQSIKAGSKIVKGVCIKLELN